jgi:hypothetical protein
MPAAVAPHTRTTTSAGVAPLTVATWTASPFPYPEPAENPAFVTGVWSNQSPVPEMMLEMRVLLRGPVGPHVRLSEPLLLTIQTDVVPTGIEVIAFEPYIHAYGVGATIEEALAEYKSMLLDLYEELQASEEILSTSLREQLKYLRSHLTGH